MGCDYTHNSFCVYISYRFNPRTIKGATFFSCPILKSDGSILIHAPVRGATAKSHKIDSDFAVLFRKFMQKLGIAIFTISIFLEKQEQYSLSSQCESPGILALLPIRTNFLIYSMSEFERLRFFCRTFSHSYLLLNACERYFFTRYFFLSMHLSGSNNITS